MGKLNAEQLPSIRQTLRGCFASSSFVCKLTVVRSRFNVAAQIRHDADWLTWCLLFCNVVKSAAKEGTRTWPKQARLLRLLCLFMFFCVRFACFFFIIVFQSQQATELHNACCLCHTRTIRKHRSFEGQSSERNRCTRVRCYPILEIGQLNNLFVAVRHKHLFVLLTNLNNQFEMIVCYCSIVSRLSESWIDWFSTTDVTSSKFWSFPLLRSTADILTTPPANGMSLDLKSSQPEVNIIWRWISC